MRPQRTADRAYLPTSNTPIRIAVVLGAAYSHLRIDIDENDVCVPFVQCSSSIQYVQPGDRVLVRTIDNLLYIETRLMRDGESPVRISSDSDGNLTVEADQALRLRTTKADIHIDGQGDLLLKANNINSAAEQENRLTGRAIKLS